MRKIPAGHPGVRIGRPQLGPAAVLRVEESGERRRESSRGTARPAEATFEASVRAFSPAARQKIAAASVRLCESIAAAHGLTADVRYLAEYPVTVNDDEQAAFAARVAGPRLLPVPRRVPARRPAAAADNHSPQAVFDDGVLAGGCLLHASLALESLRDLAAGPARSR